MNKVLKSFISCTAMVLFMLFITSNAMAFDVLSVIPEDGMMVFSLDFSRLVANDHFKEFKAELLNKPEQKFMIQELEKTGGLKLEDIKSYHAFGIKPEIMDNKKIRPAFAFMIQAPVKEEKILAFVRSMAKARELDFDKHTTIEKYMGFNIYKSVTKKDIEICGFVKEGEGIFTGTKKEIINIIDSFGKKTKNIYDNKVMSKMISDLAGNNMVWLAVDLKAVPKDQKFKGNPQFMILNDLESLVLTFDMEKQILLTINAFSQVKGVCPKITGMLNGYLGMVGMMAAQNPVAGKLLNCLDIGGSENACKISLKIDQAAGDAIKEELKKVMSKYTKKTAAATELKTATEK